MNSIPLLLAGCAASAVLAAAATPPGRTAAPQVGVVQCADRTLRLVYGLPMNLIYGPILSAGTSRAAFANDAGLVAGTRTLTLLSVDGSPLGSFHADVLGAVPGIAPSSATRAATPASLAGRVAAWLPAISSLAAWDGSRFHSVSVDRFPGVVESVVPLGATSVALFVRLPEGGVARTVVSLENGQTLSSTLAASAATSAFERNGFTLSLDAQGLEVSDASGHMQLLPLPEPDLLIDSVADNAVLLRSPSGASSSLLQLDGALLVRGALRLSVLPGPPPPSPAGSPHTFREAGHFTSPGGVQ